MLSVLGRPVIGDGGPLTVPLGSSVSIGSDGTLSAIGEGEAPDSIAEAGRLKLVSAAPGSLVRGEDGLFRSQPDANGVGMTLPADENLRLASGALEGSNVSPTAAMVAMIDNARRYDMQMKVIGSADENAQRANSLLSLQG
ncbi:Flagellar basal-body rod protein FlgF [compost metagenome]